MANKSYWIPSTNGNYSNGGDDTFDPANNYTGIRLQQGVPLLDRDWNELEDIRRYQEMILRKWYIGNGTPDNGFKIGSPTVNNFTISSGRYIVDGFEAVNGKEVPAFANYQALLAAGRANAVPTADGAYTVYLDVWLEEVPGPTNAADVGQETCWRHVAKWGVVIAAGQPTVAFHHYAPLAAVQFTVAGGFTAVTLDMRVLNGSNITFLANGNIGIGTGNPVNKLQVEGNLHMDGNSIFLRQGPGDQFDVIKWDSATDRISIGGFNGVDLCYTRGGASPLLNKALSIGTGGNVGVGISNPLYRLQVVANGGFGGENADGTSQGGNVPLVLQSDSTVFGILNASGRQAFALNIEGNSNATARGTPVFYDKFDGGWHSSIYLKNGKVGIGTNDPVNKLQVEGNLHMDGNSIFLRQGPGDQFDVIKWDTASDRISIGGFNGVNLCYTGGGTNAVLSTVLSIGQDKNVVTTGNLTIAGNVIPSAGIGADKGIRFPSDPGGGSGDSAWIRYYPRSGEACTLEIGTSNDGDDHIAMMPSGFVGIGVNAPTQKLDVVGRLKFRNLGNSAGFWLTDNAGTENVFVGLQGANSTDSFGVWSNGAWRFGIENGGNVNMTGNLSFGSQVRQMINLWSTEYGIGIQSATQYFRTWKNFAWYTGGVHNDNELNPGGGTAQMTLSGGNLTVAGNITPSAGSSASNGIRFPSDPGGGGGDSAWIRYYPRSGEACTLEIGVSNDGDDHIALMPSGNVGIGTNQPNSKLEVNGNASKPGGGFWAATSDKKLKKNIKPLANYMDKFLQLNAVSYEWKEPSKFANLTGPQIGFIAQDVEKVFPEWIDKDNQGNLMINFRGFEAILVEVIKEIVAKLNVLAAKNDVENKNFVKKQSK